MLAAAGTLALAATHSRAQRPPAARGASAPEAPTGIGTAQEDWTEFRRRYLLAEGRVVDTGNRNVSHSEGQGYAMLAAVRADDQGSFGRMLGWTLANLKRREDNLCSWRFQPDQQPNVTDTNNASDGDLFIAWALLEAGARWANADYRRRAIAIGRDLLRSCAVQVNGRWMLLPGAYGFQGRSRTVLNLSYCAFPALRALGREIGDPVWGRLETDGLALLGQARFGRYGLPPDWLEMRANGDIAPAEGWPPRFSFDAVRIPLNIVWAGQAEHPSVHAAVAFWADPDHRAMPAWTDLRTGYPAPYPAHSGIVAVARLAIAAVLTRGDAAVMPRIGSAPDYYAAALTMLSRMAWRDLQLTPAMR
ncbi:glycosyl hydrolase family 8 [Falsiroseomonas ponticola]|uniref:glycosyl hydrolase family 8 n=1 Tax=Falsiroseomonas ponticola TaxID=2786951 RepID=UPI001931A664|nr:glycosyl hydrolase family 8 [Roseomonas ponticola]